MVASKVLSLSDVALHSSKKDCWLAIRGQVLDVTKFLEDHPGAGEVLVELAGQDATKEFDDIGHSKGATELLLKFKVGVLQGFEDKYGDAVKEETKKEKKGRSAMTGSVIKDEDRIKVLRLMEFLLPLCIASIVFWFRISAAVSEMNS